MNYMKRVDSIFIGLSFTDCVFIRITPKEVCFVYPLTRKNGEGLNIKL